jgi:hypothetical protein
MAAENYPDTDFYETDEVLTSLGIGEAFVTALSEKGTPTPLVATMMRAPMSRMDVLTESEIEASIAKSKLAKKYNEVLDRESAYELLNKKITEAQEVAAEQEVEKPTRNTKQEPSTAEVVGKSITKVVTSATFIRGAFGLLMKMFKK